MDVVPQVRGRTNPAPTIPATLGTAWMTAVAEVDPTTGTAVGGSIAMMTVIAADTAEVEVATATTIVVDMAVAEVEEVAGTMTTGGVEAEAAGTMMTGGIKGPSMVKQVKSSGRRSAQCSSWSKMVLVQAICVFILLSLSFCATVCISSVSYVTKNRAFISSVPSSLFPVPCSSHYSSYRFFQRSRKAAAVLRLR